MRISFLLSSATEKAGGVYNAARGLCRALATCPETSIQVVSLRHKGEEDCSPAWEPVPLSMSPVLGPSAFGWSPHVLADLIDTTPDVVHTHGLWMYPSIAAARWNRRTRKPIVVSPHGMLDPWAIRNSRWKKRVARLIFEDRHLRNASCLHALCEPEAQSIRACGLTNPICVIPNGITLPVAGERSSTIASPLQPLKQAGRNVLLYLGRIHPKKGLVNLLKAWAEVQRSEEWALAIAGWNQGGHENELKCLATELGIRWTDVKYQKSEKFQLSTVNPQPASEASVVFLGTQFGDAKASCYANCDAFILPSFSEGLPMVILEAWAYSKPVLMTRECNLPEGFAASAAFQIGTDTETIAAGLRELLRAPVSGRQEIGAAGRNLVVERFQWPKIAAQMRSVYEWVDVGGPPPAYVLE